MKSLAFWISVILHPLLMASYGCLFIFFIIQNTIFDYLTPFGLKWRISLIVFIFSFLFPILNIFILYKLKRIPSFTLSEQSERTFPYIMTAAFYFGLFYLLFDLNIWPTVKLFVLGGGLAILLVALINLKYKISAHMVGIGGLLGALIALSYLLKFDMTFYYIGIIFLSGILASARLFLKEHNPPQLYSGFLLGLFVQIGLFLISEKIKFL
ncbi:MAG: hypothetical protein IPM51_13600 [Sphingobacteriaceae bacterium]|nr:hypothetical protein [Sphingobacteriaceae bacterium]